MGDARSELLRLVGGYMVTQALAAVLDTGLADLVDDDPVPVSLLAERTGVPAARLERLLRALRTVEVFDVADAGVVHTDRSRLLRRDADAGLAATLRTHVDRGYLSWTGLTDSLREGGSAFERLSGVPMFQWLAEHPEEARAFNESMAAGSRRRREALLARSWDNSRHVVDVGGGTGTNLLAVLEANPHLTGTLFDLPHVEDEARDHVAASPASARCSVVAGSFHEGVPVGDTYVLAVVLHDYDDEEATRILRACRRSAPEGARLVLVETVLTDDTGWRWDPWLDLHMLVLLGGRERSEDQWRALLRAGGWEAAAFGGGLVEATARPGGTADDPTDDTTPDTPRGVPGAT